MSADLFAWISALWDQADDDGGDEWTEVTDLNIPRVDLVGAGANGQRMLVAKEAAVATKGSTARRAVRKHVDPQVAVYDENGSLIGLIDQEDLNPCLL